MSARFLIEDLLTKSLPSENPSEEDNKQNKIFDLPSPSMFAQNLLSQFLPKRIIEKIPKEEGIIIEDKQINLERKGGQSEEEFTTNKIKSEKSSTDLGNLFSSKSLSQNRQGIEHKKQENNGFAVAPAWFLPFQQQQNQTIINPLLTNNCLKSLPQLSLPPQFITNLNKTNPNNGHFIPFFGHFINNHFNNSKMHQNTLNTQHKRKGGQIRFSNEQTDVLERTFGTKKYLSNIERKRIAKMLKLSERQVKTWFQNRRAKHRRQAPAEDSDESFNINQEQREYRQNVLFSCNNFLENID